MTALPSPLPWLDKAGDFANAILVKETRQALKSRQFVATFFLLLAGAWIASMLIMLDAADSIDTQPIGATFFTAYTFVLFVAVLVVVPFGAYRSLLAERDQNTFDLLSVTTLSPGQIVRGKLLSAIVQMLLFYSAIAPFIAFASLLQGFDLPIATFVLVLAMLLSAWYSLFALFLATLTTQRHWQVLTSLALLGTLVWSLWGFYAAMTAMFFVGRMGFILLPLTGLNTWEFWLRVGIVFAVGLSYFVLFYQLAVARLTFEADNRSTGIRITCSLQFWMFWGFGWLTSYLASAPLADDSLIRLSFLSGVHWWIVGVFAATESPRLSRRTRRRLPGNSLVRMLAAPLLPGGDRGLLYVFIHAGALVALVAAIVNLSPGGVTASGAVASGKPLLHAIVVAAYIVIFVGIAALIGHWGARLSPQFRAGHARLLALLAFLAGLLLPSLVRLFSPTYRADYMLLDLANPLYMLWEIEAERWEPDRWLAILVGAAGVVLALNLANLYRGVAELFERPGA